MIIPQDIIRLKRDGKNLSEQQIASFVNGLVTGEFTDAQVGAMAMAIFKSGLSNDEKVALTLAMKQSGQVINWQGIVDGPIVDKHSTGGVGDKVSLMLAPIVAACGAYVPMISGRGLGHTGGTSDKLESIPGFNIHPDLAKFKALVKELGTAIISQTPELAPADKRLYSIRDVTSTVESIPLITASILSKKLAAGLQSLVMDVKVGNGAMMHSLPESRALAQSIVDVANGAGVKTTALITDMNQVLGVSAGNSLEIIETIRYLTGEFREPRLHQVVLALAAEMIMLAGLATDEKQATAKAQAALDSGAAATIFEKMVAALGGDTAILTRYDQLLKPANVVKPVVAKTSGFIASMDTFAIGMSVVALGGGRLDHQSKVDHSVGYDAVIAKGTQVNAGDVIAMVHARSDDDADSAVAAYQQAVQIKSCFTEADPVIVEKVS